MGHYLTVSWWKPNFRSLSGDLHATLVWVQLLKLPLELFDEEVLFAIENMIGRTIKIDDATLTV